MRSVKRATYIHAEKTAASAPAKALLRPPATDSIPATVADTVYAGHPTRNELRTETGPLTITGPAKWGVAFSRTFHTRAHTRLQLRVNRIAEQ